MIEAWAERGQRQKSDLQRKLQAAISSQDPIQYLTTANDDPMAPTPEIMHQIEESWDLDGMKGISSSVDVSTGDLTPVQRQAVQRSVARAFDLQEKYPALRWVPPDPGKVHVSLMLALTYVVPGFGDVPSGSASMSSEMIPASKRQTNRSTSSAPKSAAAIAPASVRHAILAIAPTTAAEVAAAMDLGRAKGLQQIWVETADNADGRALLEDAVAAGKSRGISVYALVALMAAPDRSSAAVGAVAKPLTGIDTSPKPSAATDTSIDINIRGETASVAAARVLSEPPLPNQFSIWFRPPPPPEHDILAPESSEALAIETKRLEGIASIPGLAGIALKETSEPGHRSGADRPYMPFTSSEPAPEFGYTVANRLRFLRQFGYDPIDLPTGFIGGASWQVHNAITLPFVDTDESGALRSGFYNDPIKPETTRAWKALRADDQASFLHKLYAASENVRAQMPVYVLNGPQSLPNSPTMYELWEDTLPAPAADGASATRVKASEPVVATTGPGDIPCYGFSAETKASVPTVLWMIDANRTESRPSRPGTTTPYTRQVSANVVLDFTALPVADVIANLQTRLADAAQ